MLRNGGINTIGKKMTVCQLYAKQNGLRKNVKHGTKKGRGYYVETPKTKNGIRQIPMTEEVCQALKRVLKNRDFWRYNMEVKINTLTSELFLELYTSVGWEAPCVKQVKKALENTIATFTAYNNNQAVGMVRLIGDGGMSFYIKDFAVIPSFQSKGVGTILMESIERYIKENIDENWAVSLELISTKEAIGFYKRKGFEERPCEWDGPGMFKMIR